MALNLTGLLTQGYGVYDQLDRLDEMGKTAIEGANQLSAQATAGSQFKPFTVTGPMGNTAAATADGGVNYTLGQRDADLQSTAHAGAMGMFNQAQQPSWFREQDVYDRIRATQMPEEDRARLAMESRLLGQGRSGIRSAAYGGTPEQLAYNKAVQEAQNNASLMAIQQAQAEQMQAGQLGGMLQQAAYMPQAQLQNMYNTGLTTSQLQQASQLGGTSLAAQLGMAGLGANLEAEGMRSAVVGDFFKTLGNQFGERTGTDDDWWNDPAGWLFNQGREWWNNL